jgi:hypothetical protein
MSIEKSASKIYEYESFLPYVGNNVLKINNLSSTLLIFERNYYMLRKCVKFMNPIHSVLFHFAILKSFPSE